MSADASGALEALRRFQAAAHRLAVARCPEHAALTADRDRARLVAQLLEEEVAALQGAGDALMQTGQIPPPHWHRSWEARGRWEALRNRAEEEVDRD